MVTAGLTAALFTGVPLGTWLGGIYGWRATIWLLAGIGAVVAAVLARTAPQPAGQRPAPLAQRVARCAAGRWPGW